MLLCHAVIANLEHRHSYVRKNAVLALTAIYRLPKGELLVPDAPELVERMLQNEQVRAAAPGQAPAACGGCICGVDGSCCRGFLQLVGGHYVTCILPFSIVSMHASNTCRAFAGFGRGSPWMPRVGHCAS